MNTIAKLTLSLAMLGLVACGSSETEAAPTAAETPTAAAAPAEEAAPAEAAPAAGGDGVCARAQACCTAYVNAMPGGAASGAGAACDALAQTAAAGAVAEPACQQAIEGYRTSLTAMNVAVPAACE